MAEDETTERVSGEGGQVTGPSADGGESATADEGRTAEQDRTDGDREETSSRVSVVNEPDPGHSPGDGDEDE